MPAKQSVETASARIVRLLLDFQSGQLCDPVQLAEKLGVSRRTVFRDIAILRRSGVPIQFDQLQSMYRLVGSATNPLPRFSVPEGMVLTIAARTSPLNAVDRLRHLMHNGTEKINASLPVKTRKQLEIICATCKEPVADPRNLPGLNCLAAVIKAVQDVDDPAHPTAQIKTD